MQKNISLRQLQFIVDEIFDDLITFREDLHQHPELSWQEHRTTEKIGTYLSRFSDAPFRRIIETSGIWDYIVDPKLPYILLRADIDALPIQDKKEVHYRSQEKGICHACAHDVHTTLIVGVAQLLQKLNPQLLFNVRCVFQPAEEPIPSGAPKMIANGALEDVVLALGMHMEPRLPIGTIDLTEGWINMQSIRLDLELSGSGGHSARPHEAADLLWTASRIIQNSYQMVYRKLDLRDSQVILTFTEINAKQGYNVIPNRLSLTGTVRLSDAKKKVDFLNQFKTYLSHLENETGAKIQLKITEGSPAIHNHPSFNETVAKKYARDRHRSLF